MATKFGDNDCPDAGDIIWLDFSPTIGHEQSGHRPALVISPAIYNRQSGLCAVCPVTHTARGFQFEVPMPITSKFSGVILVDQIRTVSWRERHARLAGNIGDVRQLAEVRERLAALLEIEDPP